MPRKDLAARREYARDYQRTVIGDIRRLLIGTPCGDTIQTQTAAAVNALCLYVQAKQISVGWLPVPGTYVHANQNQIALTAMQINADAVLFVDSDMAFPHTIIDRLIARNKPVVGCVYRARTAPNHLVGKRLDGGGVCETWAGCQEMDYVPAGMLLVRRRVLAGMAFPYFFNTDGEKPGDFVGNDVNFCRAARAAGFSVWADFDASREIAHIGGVPLGWQR